MKSIGDEGEQRATEYLRQRGLKIIETNWRVDGGEIDIVARKKKQIHFVEVKSRKSGLDDAWLAVNNTKQQRLIRTAQLWIQELGKDKWSYQFDVVGVSGADIEWRQNVFSD